jgi:hypothetical protein
MPSTLPSSSAITRSFAVDPSLSVVRKHSVDLGDSEVLAIATHEWPDSRCNVRWRANGIRGQHRGKRINLRTVFSTKSYRTNPELVGIVAEPNVVPIDAAEAWAGNQLTA